MKSTISKSLLMGAIGVLGWVSQAQAIVETSYCDISSHPTMCECSWAIPDCADASLALLPDASDPADIRSKFNMTTTYDASAGLWVITVDTTTAAGRGAFIGNTNTWNAYDLVDYVESLLQVPRLKNTCEIKDPPFVDPIFPPFRIVRTGDLAKLDPTGSMWATQMTGDFLTDIITPYSGAMNVEGIDIEVNATPGANVTPVGGVCPDDTGSTAFLSFDEDSAPEFRGDQCSWAREMRLIVDPILIPEYDDLTLPPCLKVEPDPSATGPKLDTVLDQLFEGTGTWIGNFEKGEMLKKGSITCNTLPGLSACDSVTYQGALADGGELESDWYSGGSRFDDTTETIGMPFPSFADDRTDATGVCSRGEAFSGMGAINMFTLAGGVDSGDSICSQVTP